MSSSFLSTYIDNANLFLADAVPALVQDRSSRELASTVAYYYRQRGLCRVFFEGSAVGYHKSGIESSSAYLYYLGQAADEEKLLSDSAAFFDAINTGIFDVCRQYVSLAQTGWKRDYEYEDDYLYALFLMNHFFSDSTEQDDALILERYDAALEGGQDTRLNLCRAFLDHDEILFQEALEDFLEERQDRIEGLIKKNAMRESEWSWARYISIEGLALVRLAESKSFEVARHLSQIPELFRPVPTRPFDSDAWRVSR